jgi:hypothetical protein
MQMDQFEGFGFIVNVEVVIEGEFEHCDVLCTIVGFIEPRGKSGLRGGDVASHEVPEFLKLLVVVGRCLRREIAGFSGGVCVILAPALSSAAKDGLRHVHDSAAAHGLGVRVQHGRGGA